MSHSTQFFRENKMQIKIQSMALMIFVAMTATPQWSWAQNDCVKNPPNVANLVETRPGFHRVTGPLAEFNPCHSSVELSMPGFFSDKLAEKPPLMIIAHGGNGPGGAEKEMVRRMNSKGVATLLYDA